MIPASVWMRWTAVPAFTPPGMAGRTCPTPRRSGCCWRSCGRSRAERRGARYVCAIHFVLADGREFAYEADCPGVIGYETRGDRGFGYDPSSMWGTGAWPSTATRRRTGISHRGKALRLMAAEVGELVRTGAIRTDGAE